MLTCIWTFFITFTWFNKSYIRVTLFFHMVNSCSNTFLCHYFLLLLKSYFYIFGYTTHFCIKHSCLCEGFWGAASLQPAKCDSVFQLRTVSSDIEARDHLFFPDYCHAEAETVISPPVYHRLFKFYLYTRVESLPGSAWVELVSRRLTDRNSRCRNLDAFFSNWKNFLLKKNMQTLIIRMRSGLIVTDWLKKKTN